MSLCEQRRVGPCGSEKAPRSGLSWCQRRGGGRCLNPVTSPVAALAAIFIRCHWYMARGFLAIFTQGVDALP